MTSETDVLINEAGLTVSAHHSTNPLASTAASLMKLEHETNDVSRREVEAELKTQAGKIQNNDLTDMEVMLTAQAQLLHRIFAQAVEKYAEGGMVEKGRLYSGIALKSQSYCRMTIAAIASLKKTGSAARNAKKSTNELIRTPDVSDPYYFRGDPLPEYYDHNYKDPYAPLDAGRKKKPSTFDPWMAALAECGR